MNITFDSKQAKISVGVDAQQDFIGCLMTGVLAALPCFLEAFMKCLSGSNGPSTGFKPGDRDRC